MSRSIGWNMSRRMAARFLLLLAPAMLLVGLAACGSDDAAPAAPAAAPAVKAVEKVETKAVAKKVETKAVAKKVEAAKPAPKATPKPDPITLKMISAWPETSTLNNIRDVSFQEAVAELSDGALIIERAGGPESVPTFEQFDPVREGVFDILSTVGQYHGSVTSVWVYSTLLSVPRPVAAYEKAVSECGMTDWIRRGYEDIVGDIRYLGTTRSMTGVRMLVTSPDMVNSKTGAVSGKLRGASPGHVSVMESFGAAGVRMPLPSVYEAIDRGVIDGVWTGGGYALINNFKLHEVAPWIVDNSNGTGGGETLVNQATYDKLPKNLQEILDTATLRSTAIAEDKLIAAHGEAIKSMKADGLQEISLSSDAKARWSDAFLNVQFDSVASGEPEGYNSRSIYNDFQACIMGKVGG
jgi:TRAP-type mannitol/chloroaromatic compound transport system substrate-binding protein